MPIIGMTYTKINGERKKRPTGSIRVNTTPNITDVKKTDITGLGKKVDALTVKFSLNSSFEPDVGIINIEGEILYKTDNVNKVLNFWKKNKKLPKENQVEILNHIFRKVSIQALQLSDTLQLPPTLNMPRIKE